MSPLRRAASVAIALLAAGAASAAPPDEVFREPGDGKLNYRLVAKGTWTFKPPSDALRKEGVVEVGERALETLADGKTPGEGRGGRLMLAVTDLPKDVPATYEDAVYRWQLAMAKLKQLAAVVSNEAVEQQRAAAQKDADDARAVFQKDLADIAARDDVRRLLLQRFGASPSEWPETTVDADKVTIAGITAEDPEVPAAIVEARGDAGNLAGQPMPCRAEMVVAIVRGKLYRLAIWAWTTPRDREGVWRGDVEFIKNSFGIPKSSAMPSRESAGAAAAAAAPVSASGPSDETEVKPVDNLLTEGWKATKPAGLRTVPPDPTKTDRPPYSLHLESTNRQLVLTLEVKRSDERDDAGNPVGEFDARGYLVRGFPGYLSTHSKGSLESFDWPKNPRSFLALPNLEEPHPVKRPPPDKKKDWDWGELEKAKIVNEADNVLLGKHKLRNTYRMGIKGVRDGTGPDLLLRWTFALGVRSYVLTVIGYQEGTIRENKDVLEALFKSFVLDPPEK